LAISVSWVGQLGQDPLQVGVWLFNLVLDELHTLSLFEDDEKRYRIRTVVDELNQRYGQIEVPAMVIGAAFPAMHLRPPRLSFQLRSQIQS